MVRPVRPFVLEGRDQVEQQDRAGGESNRRYQQSNGLRGKRVCEPVSGNPPRSRKNGCLDRFARKF